MKEYFLWLSKLLTIVILIFVVVPLIASVTALLISKEKLSKPALSSENTVAVIEMKGEIEDTKELVKTLREQAKNESIKGIVLRVDSPGGAVAPSQDVYEAVKEVKKVKPIVASYGSLAASGGLYSTVSATKIFAQPGTLTGSIGVIMQVPNYTQIASKVGFEMVTIKSGKLKDIGNPFRVMTDDERAYLDTTVQSIYNEFVKAVSEGRNIPIEKVKEFADGRIITGSQAKELGLIDGFGDLYVAAREVFNILGKPLKEGEQPELYYPEEDDFFKEIKQFKKYLGQSMLKYFGRDDSLRVYYR